MAKDPAFREAWLRHRCIIPASWYYDRVHLAGRSREKALGDRYMLQPAGDTCVWMAGLYRMEDGLPYFTLFLRRASVGVRFIDEWMPIMLPKERIGEWILPDTKPESVLKYVLTEMVFERVK